MTQDYQVHQYVDAPVSDMRALCMESAARRYADDHRVITRAGFEAEHRATEGRPPSWRNWLPMQRRDYVRAYTLFHHGGAWVDADALLLRRLDHVVAMLAHYDLVGYAVSQTARTWETAVMVSRERGAVAEYVWRAVREYGGDGRMTMGACCALGAGMVSAMLPLYMSSRPILKLGWHTLCPIPAHALGWQLCQRAPDAAHARLVPDDAVLIPGLDEHAQGYVGSTRGLLTGSDMLLSSLFRRALG